GVIENGPFHRLSLKPSPKNAWQIAPSGPTQKTSIFPGSRATADMPEPGMAAFCGVMPNGLLKRSLLKPNAQNVLPMAPSGPTQNTSRCSGLRAIAASGDPGRAWLGGVIGNGPFQRFWLKPSAKNALPIAPSGPTQNTSSFPGWRATAVTKAPRGAALGVVMA